MEGVAVKNLIVSIGDGLSDVKMAHNYPNGISILVFTNPNGSEFEKEKPDYIARDLSNCKTILEKLIQRQHSVICYKKRQDMNDK